MRYYCPLAIDKAHPRQRMKPRQALAGWSRQSHLLYVPRRSSATRPDCGPSVPTSVLRIRQICSFSLADIHAVDYFYHCVCTCVCLWLASGARQKTSSKLLVALAAELMLKHEKPVVRLLQMILVHN